MTTLSDPALTDTLFGRPLALDFEDGGREELTLRPLPLRDYPRAVALLEDELGLTAVLAGRDRAWLERLTPASYEALYAATQSVNDRGFFAWAARQRARAEAAQTRALEQLRDLPPETLKLAAELGLAQSPTSPTSSPTPSPKRA